MKNTGQLREMGLPGANANLTQNFFKENKKFRTLNLVLVSSLSQDNLHFPLLGTLKIYFLYAKIFLNFTLETLKIISYTLKHF